MGFAHQVDRLPSSRYPAAGQEEGDKCLAVSFAREDTLTSGVDYTEVARKAHELAHAHGPDGAQRYAAKLAIEALAEGNKDEHAFWRAVEASLTIR